MSAHIIDATAIRLLRNTRELSTLSQSTNFINACQRVKILPETLLPIDWKSNGRDEESLCKIQRHQRWRAIAIRSVIAEQIKSEDEGLWQPDGTKACVDRAECETVNWSKALEDKWLKFSRQNDEEVRKKRFPGHASFRKYRHHYTTNKCTDIHVRQQNDPAQSLTELRRLKEESTQQRHEWRTRKEMRRRWMLTASMKRKQQSAEKFLNASKEALHMTRQRLRGATQSICPKRLEQQIAVQKDRERRLIQKTEAFEERREQLQEEQDIKVLEKASPAPAPPVVFVFALR